MPADGEQPKKRSQKKKPTKQKTKSKQRTNGKNLATNSNKQSKLTPENLSSLRWDFKLADPILENDRIEKYKELRRERYNNAREQAIQTLIETMKLAETNE